MAAKRQPKMVRLIIKEQFKGTKQPIELLARIVSEYLSRTSDRPQTTGQATKKGV